MAMFRNNLIIIEARPLIGTATETMDVVDWVRNTGGYPWLLGNANEPDTLAREDGQHGLKGVYLDPADGSVVIRNEDGSTMRASYGYYILCKNGDEFETMEAADFLATYEPA